MGTAANAATGVCVDSCVLVTLPAVDFSRERVDDRPKLPFLLCLGRPRGRRESTYCMALSTRPL